MSLNSSQELSQGGSWPWILEAQTSGKFQVYPMSFFILFHSECLIEDLTVQGPAGLAHRGEDRVGGCETFPRVHGDQAGAGGGAVQLPG